MNTRQRIGLLLLCLAGGLLLARAKGCDGIGGAAPFKTDKLAVLVVEESAEHGRYTATQLDAIQATDAGSVKAVVEGRGGEFHVIDESVPADKLALAPGWVQEAFKVPRQGKPWVVAAGQRSGFSVPLTTEADLLKRIEGVR